MQQTPLITVNTRNVLAQKIMHPESWKSANPGLFIIQEFFKGKAHGFQPYQEPSRYKELLTFFIFLGFKIVKR